MFPAPFQNNPPGGLFPGPPTLQNNPPGLARYVGRRGEFSDRGEPNPLLGRRSLLAGARWGRKDGPSTRKQYSDISGFLAMAFPTVNFFFPSLCYFPPIVFGLRGGLFLAMLAHAPWKRMRIGWLVSWRSHPLGGQDHHGGGIRSRLAVYPRQVHDK